ncbi:cell wall-binding protein [Desulfosporosinus acidiphilus SJ4]|uniref:Cell wall-binding protein n=1 Tax=Desulfosporosinus acidiphilus (strain DSM 22704 / JCM 16185 / SJ4) TaxID=646529 RepID=I4DBU4_DESAJ|nr:cell wall-binding repeat-containing protein [Desulfosporosinus acidiphilus]AFM43268.1 cell wall-binding protein [Desulfosporosinus acidiphilus SJ4]
MKKTNKALASLAIAGMALTVVPFNAFADNAVPTRLAGNTAAQTAAAIADQTGWTGTAILASSASYGMVDALTAGPLSSYLKAPILLTGPGNTLDSDTKAELTKLNVKTVYVTSGKAVISQAVLDQLSGMGINVVSLGGQDRAETSVNIAKKMVGVTKVAVANGLQDALSIASIASAANEPILLTDKDSVPSSVAAYLAANPSITSTDVIGGTGVISNAVAAQFPNATRHFGTTAYDTNNQVIQDFSSSLQFTNVYVANGQTGIDALAGAPLAALTKSPIVLTDGTVPAAATFVHSKLATGAVVTALGGAAVVSDSVRTGVLTGSAPNQGGPVAVTSVTAVSASSFKVQFTSAPADTSKVTFAVTNSGAPVTVTPTWDSSNTFVTLSGSANFPEGTYAVDVKNGDTDLGSSTVAITTQKIAKINITATKLAVTQATTGSGIGYATYTVTDQYGNDITSNYLANNIQWQCGVGNITTPSHGVLKVTPNGQNLLTFSTVVITGYDSTSGVSASATLPTSTAMGTLSSITLNKLTNVNNTPLRAADTSDTWYVDYTANDMSGNPTNDYNLVKNGLILTGTNSDQLSVSSPYVIAKVVQDPNDSNKAAIQVTVTTDTVQMDMPVTITAMSWQGAPSSLQLTLKKQSAVDTFTLEAPSYNIASGELKQIPFVAYDQDGKQLTKYSDIVGSSSNPIVTISGFGDPSTGAGFVQNPDGTASLYMRATNVTGNQSVPQILTANTSTGKFSSVTINVQPTAKADTMVLNSTSIINTLQAGANQRIDFGYNYGGLTVNDQYGRPMDLDTVTQTGNGYNYEVVAMTSATTGTAIQLQQLNSGENVTTSSPITYAIAGGGNGIEVLANPSLTDNSTVNRTQTVNFYLINKSDEANVLAGQTNLAIASSSMTFSVIKNKDITGYTIDKVANPIFAQANSSTSGAIYTHQQTDEAANPDIYGTTSGGSKVMLAPGFIEGVSVDSPNKFKAVTVAGGISNSTNAYDSVKVIGLPLDASLTSASTNLTVTLMGADGLIHTVVAPIASSTTSPVAKELDLNYDGTAGMHMSDDGTTLYIDNATAMATEFGSAANPVSLQRNDAYGAANAKDIYFYIVDSYGKKGMNVSNIFATDWQSNGVTRATAIANSQTTVSPLNLDATTLYATGAPGLVKNGDYVTLSAVTNNGLVKTVKIVRNYN